MKHYNTTRNIKRKLRNLTRRIKAGRKSRLLFKTGDLGKNLSKMTKKVTQRGGLPGQKPASRPHVNVEPGDIARIVGSMAGPIQLAHHGNDRNGPIYVWTKNTEEEFKNVFADAVKYGKIPYINTKMKFVVPRPAAPDFTNPEPTIITPPTEGAMRSTVRAAYADARQNPVRAPLPSSRLGRGDNLVPREGATPRGARANMLQEIRGEIPTATAARPFDAVVKKND